MVGMLALFVMIQGANRRMINSSNSECKYVVRLTALVVHFATSSDVNTLVCLVQQFTSGTPVAAFS